MTDTLKSRCGCPRCLIRGFTGPVILIVIGAIFLCGEYTRYGFDTLWPVVLVVIGILLLAQSTASREGHIGAPARKDGASGPPDL